MATIQKTLEIDRPVAQVWTVFEDVRRLPEFSRSTVKVMDAPERLSVPGQTFRQVVRKFGRSFESEWVLLAVEPDHCLTIEGSIGMGVKYRITEVVEPLGPDRTRASLTIDFKLPFGPLGRVARRLGVDKVADVEAGEVLVGLKALLEATPARSTPAHPDPVTATPTGAV